MSSSVKAEIVSSLFSKRSPEDGSLEETYIAHLKILDRDEKGPKPRYLLLASSRSGEVSLHKSKRNSNNTFSIGKTWNLADVRAVEVFDPLHFAIVMAKSYGWETEREREQASFLETLVKVFKRYTKGRMEIRCIGWQPREEGGSSSQLGTSPASSRRPSNDFMSSSIASSPSESVVSTSARSSQAQQTPPLGASTSSSASRSRPQLASTQQPSASYYNGSEHQPSPSSSPAPLSQQRRPSHSSQQSSGMSRSKLGADNGTRTMASEIGRSSSSSGREGRVEGGPERSRTHDSERGGERGPVPSRSRTLESARSDPQDGSSKTTPTQSTPIRLTPSPSASYATAPHPTSTPSSSSRPFGANHPPLVPANSIPAADLSSAYDGISSPTIKITPSALPSQSEPRSTTPTQIDSPSFSNKQTPTQPSSSSISKPSSPLSPPHPAPMASSSSRSIASLAPPGSANNSPAPSSSTTRPNTPSISINTSSSQVQQPHSRATLQPAQLQTSFSRDLLLSDDPLTPMKGGGADSDDEGEDVILTNVEEMLETWDWSSMLGSGDLMSNGGKGKFEMEKSLGDELSALEAANIHSFLEADDRVALVLEDIDKALLQLDETDAKILSFKFQLNAVSDDISYIESQNRGLQVQTSNQKALLAEIENLLQIVHVDSNDMAILTQDSLETDRGIQSLENAAASLYKALQAGKDTTVGDMAAAIERMREYETHNAQFCKRVSDYLTIMIKFQAEKDRNDNEPSKSTSSAGPVLRNHAQFERSLLRYAGLILYMREMDVDRYQKLCGAYFSIVSDVHKQEMKNALMGFINKVKKSVEEESAESFVTGGAAPVGQLAKASGLARSKTIAALRNPDRVKEKKSDSEMKASEAFERVFTQIANVAIAEEAFLTSFLALNPIHLETFADYMTLEPYFRRQANRFAEMGLSGGDKIGKLARQAMDLIFGFLAGEMKGWVDGALQRDQMQIVGIMAACERLLTDSEDRNCEFLIKLFQKQLQRLNQLLDQFIAAQVKAIEGTKLTIKKRKGVAPFVKHFPVFIDRFESQLVGTDGLEIRSVVDGSYERIANAMFDSLQSMARMDGGAEGLAPEDKGQLNYHVILIENMHFFVAEMAQQNPATFQILMARAQGIYRENLDSYIRLVLRKPLAKIIDYFEGIERLLTTAAPSEVATHSQYTRASLKKVIKEHDAKDMRKAIEAIYKRIHKHFDQSLTAPDLPSSSSSELIEEVSSESQSALASLVNRWEGLIARCYGEGGVPLEFSINDLSSAFKKAKAGL